MENSLVLVWKALVMFLSSQYTFLSGNPSAIGIHVSGIPTPPEQAEGRWLIKLREGTSRSFLFYPHSKALHYSSRSFWSIMARYGSPWSPWKMSYAHPAGVGGTYIKTVVSGGSKPIPLWTEFITYHNNTGTQTQFLCVSLQLDDWAAPVYQPAIYPPDVFLRPLAHWYLM